MAVGLAAAVTAGGGETEGFSRAVTAAGPDADRDANPAGRADRRVERYGEVLAGVDRGSSSTPPSDGPVAGW